MFFLLWWVGFTAVCIWAQSVVPGVDFLIPGLVLLLQEDRRLEAFWAALLWVPLQDGMGNLASGYSLLWYFLVVLAYCLGRWLFESRSLLFMALIGVFLGGLHVALTYAMISLEFLVFPAERVFWEGIMQAVLFPVEWLLLTNIYPKRMRAHDAAH